MAQDLFPMDQWLVPDKKFRSAPFWSWNGKLEKEELLRQIRIFKKMGMGGFFMHSRIGLETKYLSPEWFEMIHACVEEAGVQGMDAWLYDEDRWPSGYAGGMVTENPDYRMHLIFLTEVPFEECSTFETDPQSIGLFAGVIHGVKAEKIHPVASPAEVRQGETLLQFVYRADSDSTWYNNCSYLNPMNRAAVEKFIAVTHEAYRKECADEFGRRIPGIFTDEPQYGFVVYQREWENETQYSTPFDMQIRDEIKKRYHYDITERIYELFFEVRESPQPVSRLHYIQVMTELFLRNYAEPIGEWCKQHDLCYTGHVMGEDFLSTQTWNCGSPMRYYRHMGMPGIDLLKEVCSNYFIARELSSAGRQFGKRDRLVELYGCTGWDFPPVAHKAIGDWLMALGVNFRCQHLAHYTMAGEGKRDYPASIRDHLTWFEEYKSVEDYFGRINAVLSCGEESCDILLLSPNESAWCMICKDYLKSSRVYEFDRKFAELNMTLQSRTLDFDIGDEGVLAEDGVVSDGVLKVGLMSYKAVVIPQMLTMRSSTCKLLEELEARGAILVFADGAPEYVDGYPDPRVEILRRKCSAYTLDSLEKFRRIKVSENAGEILVQSRYGKNFDSLFVVNTSCVPGATAELPAWSVPLVKDRKTAFPVMEIQWHNDRAGKIYELDPESGRIMVPRAEKKEDLWRIHTSFAALQSRLFIVTEEELPAAEVDSGREEVETIRLPEEFEYRAENENLLILDHFRCRLNGTAFNENAEYVLLLDDRLRQALHIPVRNARMVQPWVETACCGETAEVELMTEFECEVLPEGEVFLALETPEEFRITLNGVEIPSRTDLWYFDHSLKKIILPEKLLREGRNELVLKLRYDCRFQGLESMYIGGCFGVIPKGVNCCIVKLTPTLHCGDFTEQGFAFYNGSIRCFFPVKRSSDARFLLKIPVFHGACCKISCNGKFVKSCLWGPYEADLSSFVSPGGEALVELEIIGSPRNMMGPFFYGEDTLSCCAPRHFKEYHSDHRKLAAFGIA